MSLITKLTCHMVLGNELRETLSGTDTVVLQECHEPAPAGCWEDVTVVGPILAFRSMFSVMWNADTQLFEAFPEHENFLQWLLPDIV